MHIKYNFFPQKNLLNDMLLIMALIIEKVHLFWTFYCEIVVITVQRILVYASRKFPNCSHFMSALSDSLNTYTLFFNELSKSKLHI